MSNVIIVGNGLFGSIAAELCRRKGHAVTLITNHEPLAASKASGCVIAPSWLTSIPARDRDNGLALLDELYGLRTLEFDGPLGARFTAQQVDPDRVLLKPDIVGTVTTVVNDVVKGESRNGDFICRGKVLVAAGVWSEKLVPMPRIRGLYGASVRFEAQLPVPKIHVYAPYKQAVAYQLNKKQVWFGDGTALIRKTWEAEREARIDKTIQRGRALLEIPSIVGHRAKVTEGIRPYVEGHKAGYFAKTHPNTWVSTGGAKNGTVLAAVQALQFVKEAKL